MNKFSISHLWFFVVYLLSFTFAITLHRGGKANFLTVRFSEQDITIYDNSCRNVTLFCNSSLDEVLQVTFNFTDADVLQKIPDITLQANTSQNFTLEFKSINVGHTVLFANTSVATNMTDLSEAFVRVSVSHSESLDYVCEAVGWFYFLTWSISFYPQTYTNYKRNSVIGLHFDFLTLNIVGFMYYSIFNICLYWIPLFEAQYFDRHPFGVNPVQINDVIFAIHAFFACAIQVVQCLIYDKGDQKVSRTTRAILMLIGVSTVVVAALGSVRIILWLDFIYFVSYVKLFITLIKYIPQAYYNYRRKSTLGWSIGNVLLDFTGGSFSILQMFLLSYNYNDWSSIFGDPTKFGLGLFSILFDILFIIQHYVLYPVDTSLFVTSSQQRFASDDSVESLLGSSVSRRSYGSTL